MHKIDTKNAMRAKNSLSFENHTGKLAMHDGISYKNSTTDNNWVRVSSE